MAVSGRRNAIGQPKTLPNYHRITLNRPSDRTSPVNIIALIVNKVGFLDRTNHFIRIACLPGRIFLQNQLRPARHNRPQKYQHHQIRSHIYKTANAFESKNKAQDERKKQNPNRRQTLTKGSRQNIKKLFRFAFLRDRRAGRANRSANRRRAKYQRFDKNFIDQECEYDKNEDGHFRGWLPTTI